MLVVGLFWLLVNVDCWLCVGGCGLLVVLVVDCFFGWWFGFWLLLLVCCFLLVVGLLVVGCFGCVGCWFVLVVG